MEREDGLKAGGEHQEGHDRAQGNGNDRGGCYRGGRPADKHHRHQDHPGGAALADRIAHGGIFRLLSYIQSAEKYHESSRHCQKALGKIRLNRNVS
jgi:hypothetical protein